MGETKKIYHAADDTAYSDIRIDVEDDRVRELSDGTKVPYHYIHAYAAGTNLKFTVAMPEKDRFGGHFMQYLSPFPGPDEEVVSYKGKDVDDKVAFALIHGFAEVESNMASETAFGVHSDDTLRWKTSAQAAEAARRMMAKYYGYDKHIYGYVYGGSGGGYKTLACIENTDTWDGAAPFIIGSPASLPNTICMHVQGQRLLRNCFCKVVDAIDAGGSGDPYEDLTEEEKEGLSELTNMGIPMKAWFLESRGAGDPGSLPVLLPGVKAFDPSYFTDFWTKPGYEGYDNVLSTQRDRICFDATVVAVHQAGEKAVNAGGNGVDDAFLKMMAASNGSWIEMDQVPEGDDLYIDGTQITFPDGDAAGAMPLGLGSFNGRCAVIGSTFGVTEDDVQDVLSKVKPGDHIHLDNSDYIAIQSYYRHQVPDDLNFHAWDQFRDENGKATLPQRSTVMGYGFTGTGTVQDGHIQGKAILTQALSDESTCPWCGDWYKSTVRDAGHADDFRLYYFENAIHGDVEALQSTFITNYLGQLRQVLLDLSAWVERGVDPLPDTIYSVDRGQIHVPATAAERRGLQPVVRFAAKTGDGEFSDCVTVKPGEEITFTASAEVPQNTGAITEVRFDFAEEDHTAAFGKPVFETEGTFTRTDHGAAAGITHAYQTPGVHYAAVRFAANRDGSSEDIYTQIRNLARVKVIVEE